MILLKAENDNNYVVIIGLGLIGSAVLKRFFKFNWFPKDQLKVNWQEQDFFKFHFFRWITSNLNPSIYKLDFIWSAGKSGFGSEEQECLFENHHFKNFLDSVDEILKTESFNLKIHYVSSAGSLYEGQLGVNKLSIPSPKRPYGFAKLFQEFQLSSKFVNSHFIYRPSSVYGPIQNGKRLGLISRMIQSLRDNSEITIFGGMATLRDFIWVDDVAGPIVDNILGYLSIESNIIFLVSAKPTSIIEVNDIIFKSTGKRLLYKFDKTMNFSSMSFSRELKSNSVINLELGIELILMKN